MIMHAPLISGKLLPKQHKQQLYVTKKENFALLFIAIFTCVAEGQSRSRSAVTPSVRLSFRLSVRPSQNLVIETPLKLLIRCS